MDHQSNYTELRRKRSPPPWEKEETRSPLKYTNLHLRSKGLWRMVALPQS